MLSLVEGSNKVNTVDLPNSNERPPVGTTCYKKLEGLSFLSFL